MKCTGEMKVCHMYMQLYSNDYSNKVSSHLHSITVRTNRIIIIIIIIAAVSEDLYAAQSSW